MKKLDQKYVPVAASIIKYKNDSIWGYSQKAVVAEFPKADKAIISRIAKLVRQNKWKMPPVFESKYKTDISLDLVDDDGHQEEKLSKAKKGDIAKGGAVELAGIKTKTPPVTFLFKGDEIAMNVTDLFECHILYQDMKSRADITDNFSECIKIAMETLWQLTVKPRIEGEVVKYA